MDHDGVPATQEDVETFSSCPSDEVLTRLIRSNLEPTAIKAVERHVERCLTCQTALDRLSGSAPTFVLFLDDKHRPADRNSVQTRAPLPEVPGFELLDEIGRGGMGVVYRARQSALGRLVALKMISAGESAAESDTARFRREAATIAQLNDPHIVQLYEIGIAQGKPYLAMEYVPGQALSELIRESLPPPKQAAHLIAVLARSMHSVHERGIVHRDLKPANILVASEGLRAANGWSGILKPKITDFGLAKAITDSCGPTMTGGVLGTPSYMSPEQARGEAQVGPAADIYGLGAILYELLVGRPPFKSFQVVNTLEQVLNQEPIPPRRLQPQLPLDLDTICLKCLEKLPERRYLTAAALAQDLERFLRHEPIAARPVAPAARLLRWCRRHPAGSAAIALGLMAAVSLALLSIVYPFALAQARSAAAMRVEQQKTAQALNQVSALHTKAEELSASLAINQGQALCERGSAARGLLWLARGLELAPTERSVIANATRKDIAAWRQQVHALKSVRALPRESLAMAINPSGEEVALAGWDRQLRMFDTRAGEELCLPLHHRQPITAVAYSGDGNCLASGCLDGTITLWDTATRQMVRSWPAHAEQVYALRFAAADRQLVSSSRDSTVKRWKVADGSRNGQPLVHDGPVIGLAITPDGRRFLTGSADRFVRRWDVTTGELVGQPSQHPSGVMCLGISHDGKAYIVGRQDGTAQVFDATTDLPRGRMLEHRAMVSSCVFSPDDRHVLTASRDCTAQLWDVATSQPIGSPLEHQDELCTALFTSDGRTVASTGDDRTLRLWHIAAIADSTAGQPAVSQVSPPVAIDDETSAWESRQFFGMRWRHIYIQTVGFSPSGRLAYAIADEGLEIGKSKAIQLYRTATGEPIGSPLPHDSTLVDLAFSPNEAWLISVSRKGTARLWNATTGSAVAIKLPAKGAVNTAAFHPGNNTLVTAGRKNIELWKCPEGEVAQNSWPVERPVQCVFFDHSGDRMAVIFTEGDIAVHDARSGRCLWSLPVEDAGSVSSASFSNDDAALMASHWNGPVRVWHLNAESPAPVVLTHREPVWAAKFSPDGGTVAAATSAGNVYLWDSESGHPIGTPFQQREFIDDLAFSPDGQTLLLGTYENKLRLVDTATCRAIGPARLCAAPVQHVRFLGAGDYYASGDQTRLRRVYASPLPQEGTVNRIQRELETLTGLTLGDDGVIRALGAEAWDKARQVAVRQHEP